MSERQKAKPKPKPKLTERKAQSLYVQLPTARTQIPQSTTGTTRQQTIDGAEPKAKDKRQTRTTLASEYKPVSEVPQPTQCTDVHQATQRMEIDVKTSAPTPAAVPEGGSSSSETSSSNSAKEQSPVLPDSAPGIRERKHERAKKVEGEAQPQVQAIKKPESPLERFMSLWFPRATPITQSKAGQEVLFTPLPPESSTTPDAKYMVRKQKLETGAELSLTNYYHGLLPKEEVNRLLHKNGDFLVRDSDIVVQNKIISRPTLSVRWNGQVQHFLIGRTKKGRYHIGFHMFDTVADLIEWYQSALKPLTDASGALLRTSVGRRHWHFTHNQIKLVFKLGEGLQGKTHRGYIASDRLSSCEVAVKVLGATNNRCAELKERLKFFAEFKAMRRFGHPNVARLLGLVTTGDPTMIVMEYYVGGSLVNLLRNRSIKLGLPEHVRFCTESAAGMTYLEGRKLIHRNLAARNCLIGPKHEIKVADYGIAMYDVVKLFKESNEPKMPVKWFAPETLRGCLSARCLTRKFTVESDVWSFGVLMWEVFADGKQPYPGWTKAETRERVAQNCYRMSVPEATPTQIEELITLCWEESPLRRPKFPYLLKRLITLQKSLT